MTVADRRALGRGAALIAPVISLALGLAPLADGADLERASTTQGATPPPVQFAVDQLVQLDLVDIHGNPVSLWRNKEKGYRVVVFLGCECPLVKHYMPKLSELAKRFESRGVRFVGVNSNDQDSLTEIDQFARQQQSDFPIYKDRQQRASRLLQAERTPEAILLNESGTVLYRGRIDDSAGIGYQRPAAKRRLLENAIERALQDGGSSPFTSAVGCLIGQRPAVTPHGSITFSDQIIRIIHRRCAECHRAGQLAPFSLLDYESASNWAPMIAEVVTQERMPPWFASPKYGHFSNDTRLSAEERQSLLAWIANGCPEGDPQKMPAPPTFPDGWRIDEPHVVLHMRDEPFDVPAQGPIDYQEFVVETNWAEDRWVQQAEIRPGDPAVVHHCATYIIPPGAPRDIFDAQPSFTYSPGLSPLRLPPGAAIRIPAKAALILQLHYEPNGRPARDRSSIGLRFIDASQVKRPVVVDALWPDQPLAIPPNAAAYQVRGSSWFARDAELIAFLPHMHLRGTQFRYELEYPDGRREVLLDVPRYDFNWQSWYYLATPKVVPKGSRLRGFGVFDNSDHNPRNPDPSKSVPYGARTVDEMFVGVYAAYDSTARDVPVDQYAYNAEGFAVNLPNLWKLETTDTAKAQLLSPAHQGDVAHLRVERLARGNGSDIRLSRPIARLEKGQTTLVALRARASKTRPAALTIAEPGQSNPLWRKEVLLRPTWIFVDQSIEFQAPAPDAVLSIEVGQTFGDVQIDHVVVMPGSRRHGAPIMIPAPRSTETEADADGINRPPRTTVPAPSIDH